MTLCELTQFFMWGTILGVGVLLLSTIGWLALRAPGKRLHERIFGISSQTIDITFYAYLALIKACTLVFFIIPWLALLIVDARNSS